jgi:hypothetical protein
MQTTEHISRTFSDLPDDRSDYRVAGRDIAAIGYIPQCIDPPGAYSSVTGMGLMFRSGNYQPPSDISGPTDFVRYLASRREYRGALMVSNIEVIFERTADPKRVSFTILDDAFGCGYTLVQSLGSRPTGLPRPAPGSHQWRKSMVAPLKGKTRGGSRLRIRGTSGMVQVDHWQTFQLSWAMQKAARAMTGSAPPFAWMMVTCRVFGDGGTDAHATASCVPTIRTFSDWRPLPGRCMLQNAQLEIDQFVLGTDRRRLAPSWGWRERLI